jgi:outer membrane protein OmpA-like peptidoglycan-associated protein
MTTTADRGPKPADTVTGEVDMPDEHFLPETRFTAHGFGAGLVTYDYTSADVIGAVYFAFDSAKVSREESVKISALAKMLAKGPAQQILVVGNCDRFGTEQCNHILGQRRAEAVRAVLVESGIDNGRVVTASLGFSRARADVKSKEEGLADRRCDIVVRRR